jgi:hypothetical protein
VNDDTGKAFGFQLKVTPSQPVAKALGYLAFQPAEIGKFMEDHICKVRSILGFAFIVTCPKNISE